MKSKPIVQIYERKTATGTTIYLHYTINGKQHREATGLRLTGNKTTDSETRKAAIMLQTERTAEILSGKTGIKTDSIKDRILLTDFCNDIAQEYGQAGQKSCCLAMKALFNYLTAYKPKYRVIDVDKKFCTGFIDFLKNTTQQKKKAHHKQTEKRPKDTTVKYIYGRFILLLNKAVKSGIIENNVSTKVDRPKAQQTERTYLTENEIKEFSKIETTTAAQTETKDAFLFSFFTGLRYSDICRLTAANFEQTESGLKVKILTKKTDKYISFVVSKSAESIIIDRLQKPGNIFDLKDNSTENSRVKAIAKAAKINKNISFHTARHTFATMLLTKGADLYTVSTMLGHSNISTTQIYAKIVDSKKDQAASLLNL